ncbi:cytochrome b [Pseudomonas putida]|uniref:cytochrome b n=1 Tax=Pseudomonas putida TaxID=303 RepID=UPI0023660AB5|nr:cytochrome b/b6 domain-containing protein [Pseudomonas putida]MDD2048049.1 cytochrome b/b6 domain-containing protein [Pseudomonas putida]
MEHELQTCSERYSAIQVLLHWVSAVVILWTLISAGYVLLFAGGTPLAAVIADFNVALTTLFIPLFIWRFWLRCTSPSRGGEPDGVARMVHLLLYGFTALVLLSGVLMMERPIDLFGWLQIPQLLQAPAWSQGFSVLHRLASLVLALLVVLHILAVIWHECLGRRVLWRMQIKRRGGRD